MEKTSYASPSVRDLTAMAAAAAGTRPVKIIQLQHPNTTASTSNTGGGVDSYFEKWKAKMRRKTSTEWIQLFLPCSRWIRAYKWREYLQADLNAGITVVVMLVSQLAGLQPIYGLYSGFVPIFVYAIFGSSRQLAIGPVALTSLLVSNVLSSIVDSSEPLYTELAILLAFMVGVLECIMGILRLGWLIRFISHSVISGFTTASAIVIALSQAKYFLGYQQNYSIDQEHYSRSR